MKIPRNIDASDLIRALRNTQTRYTRVKTLSDSLKLW